MMDSFRKIAGKRRIFLFLDYDGTLVPIKSSPELAILRPSRRHTLERLSRRIPVCIVSGRALTDIRKMVGIKDIAYIGNHGLEMLCRGRRWVHPEAKMIRPLIKKTLDVIREKSGEWPGLLIEDKGLTGSIHYRRLTATLPKGLREIIENEVRSRSHKLKLTEGKKVFEIRPNIDWNKGEGVRELGHRLDARRRDLRIYIGDDQTDEDAFGVLGKDDLTILVGKKRSSLARSRLTDVNAVWKFLAALLQSEAPPPQRLSEKPFFPAR